MHNDQQYYCLSSAYDPTMTTQTADTGDCGSPGGDDAGSDPDTVIEFGARTTPTSGRVVGGQPVKRLRGGRPGRSRSGLLARDTMSTGAR